MSDDTQENGASTGDVTASKTKTRTADAKPRTEATKSAVAEQPATRRVKMNTCMAGFHQVVAPDGTKRNGAEFVRLPDKDYDVETAEADRLVEAGYASYLD